MLATLLRVTGEPGLLLLLAAVLLRLERLARVVEGVEPRVEALELLHPELARAVVKRHEDKLRRR